MKTSIDIIIELLTHIINQSLRAGTVPSEMKIAKVIPIHKSSDSSMLSNYRPVGLLPAFSKLLEKIVFNALMTFMIKNKIRYLGPNIQLFIQFFTNEITVPLPIIIPRCHWLFCVIYQKGLMLLIMKFSWNNWTHMEYEV